MGRFPETYDDPIEEEKRSFRLNYIKQVTAVPTFLKLVFRVQASAY